MTKQCSKIALNHKLLRELTSSVISVLISCFTNIFSSKMFEKLTQ